ncbi:MAG: hypothetical protein J6Y69_00030 [Treponema sp.]|nr:hypothetical protein [Treponema sp.]
MKRLNFSLLLISSFLFAAAVLTGCKREPTPTPSEPAYEVSLSDIHVNDPISITKNSIGFKKLVFTYPTKNVAGETVRASAIMLIPSSIYNAAEKPKLDYMVLSSHGATTNPNEVPSYGDKTEQLEHLIGSRNAVGIAADYIGFGESSEQLQAFAYGDLNAMTSLDAVICARKWLESQGYTWEDKLANAGFSQGGQTAMHVQKLVDTTAYGSLVNVTKTFAGGGCYDMVTMVDCSIDGYNPPLMPSVIWLGIASYNSLSNMGYSLDTIFKDADHIQDLLDKEADLSTGMMQAWSTSLQPDMLNPDSALRNGIRQKTASFNCKFTPKTTSKILMFSDSHDDVVPTENSDDLFSYFNSQDFTMTRIESAEQADFSQDNVYIRYSTGTYGTGCHRTAGSDFYTGVATELQRNW